MISKDAYMLVDGVLDNGLSFVASYLENKINNPIIITDDHGQIYHPTISHSKQIDKRSIQIPTIVFRKEHYYDSKNATLYYCIRCNKSSRLGVMVSDSADRYHP